MAITPSGREGNVEKRRQISRKPRFPHRLLFEEFAWGESGKVYIESRRAFEKHHHFRGPARDEEGREPFTKNAGMPHCLQRG